MADNGDVIGPAQGAAPVLMMGFRLMLILVTVTAVLFLLWT